MHELKRAASKNQISILGRWRGTEEAEKVPVDDYSIMTDYRGRAIVGNPSYYRDGDYWTHLVVRPAECKARWPVEPTHIIKTQATNAPPPPPKVRGMSMWPSVDRSATASPLAPTYARTVTYSAKVVPEQFTRWAEEQWHANVIITDRMAEDAMRGPKNENGDRIGGGRLPAGTGLSRETIRAWVAKLPEERRARQGVPPSRTK